MHEAYLKIQASGITDPAYHAANFGNLPLNQVFATLEQIKERDHHLANNHSRSLVYLISTVRGIAGNNKEVDLNTLLPYPPKDGTEMTQQTARIIAQLMDRGKVPIQVIQSMGKYLDDVGEVDL